MSDLKARLKARTKRAPALVNVTSLEEVVAIRRLSLAERDEYEARMFDKTEGKVTVESLIGVRAYLVATTVLDPDTHQPLFTEEEVSLFDSDVALELHTHAQEVNGLNKKVEDTAGN